MLSDPSIFFHKQSHFYRQRRTCMLPYATLHRNSKKFIPVLSRHVLSFWTVHSTVISPSPSFWLSQGNWAPNVCNSTSFQNLLGELIELFHMQWQNGPLCHAQWLLSSFTNSFTLWQAVLLFIVHIYSLYIISDIWYRIWGILYRIQDI